MRLQSKIPAKAIQRVADGKLYLQRVSQRILQGAMSQVNRKRQSLPQLSHLIQVAQAQAEKQRYQLMLMRQKVADASPDKLLARGYSITLRHGRVVKDASLLKPGDEIVTRLKQGEAVSIVK